MFYYIGSLRNGILLCGRIHLKVRLSDLMPLLTSPSNRRSSTTTSSFFSRHAPWLVSAPCSVCRRTCSYSKACNSPIALSALLSLHSTSLCHLIQEFVSLLRTTVYTASGQTELATRELRVRDQALRPPLTRWGAISVGFVHAVWSTQRVCCLAHFRGFLWQRSSYDFVQRVLHVE